MHGANWERDHDVFAVVPFLQPFDKFVFDQILVNIRIPAQDYGKVDR